MLHGISEWTTAFLSAALCSSAIKLLDDYLDRELDDTTGEHNWINDLGEGAIAYSLPLLAVSVALYPQVGLALFIASWSIGMYRDLHIIYPSMLRGWQEFLIGTAAGVYLSGWSIMLCSLFIAGAVQLCDDIIDRYTDQATGMRNLAHRWGAIPCGVASIVLLISASFIVPSLFWPVIGGIAAIYIASARKRRRVHG